MKKFYLIATSILIAISTLATIPASSAAEKGWRYWGYFQATPSASAWTSAMTGPTVEMADGSVEGWVFTFSGGSVTNAAQPSVKPSFAKICGRTKAIAGTKRVALVVDFGPKVLAPKGEKVQKTITTCVNVAKESTGFDVLGMALKVRTSAGGFVCGFNGYPAKECGTEISTPKSLIPKK